MARSKTAKLLLPLFLGFYVMGFVDFAGIATSYVKAEFSGALPDEFFGFLPSAVLVWFLVFSIPSAVLMGKIGRRNTALLSAAITALSAALAFCFDSIWFCVAGFALLGIGNIILQVSMMPLLSACVVPERLASAASAGQSIKALSSFAGPFIALFAAEILGSWRWIFPIFGAITILFGIWLYFTDIPEPPERGSASIGKVAGLLSNRTILALFFAIVAVVGLDMGMNMASPMVLMEKLGLDPSLESSVRRVGLAPSVYFACRTAGTFAGAAILSKIDSFAYFKMHIILAIFALVFTIFSESEMAAFAGIGLVGYSISSIYSVVFSRALNEMPDSENEISGLMTTGIAGGAAIPPVMTFAQGVYGGVSAALAVMVCVCLYLVWCSFCISGEKNSQEAN